MTGLSFSRIPMATGMVEHHDRPSMEPVSTPPSMAPENCCQLHRQRTAAHVAGEDGSGEDMAGSAPQKGEHRHDHRPGRLASTGARQTIPTMASAREPAARDSLFKFNPQPQRFPKNPVNGA